MSQPFAFIEPLESRIAPAVLVNPLTVTYTDIDGDLITVTVSKGDLTGRLTFVNAFDATGPQQLKSINLSSPQFAGANLTLTSTFGGGAADDYAHFGFLNAKGVDLGDVSLEGDVGKIIAGDAKANTPGLGNLALHNLGNSTNVGAPDFVTKITGSVGAVTMNNVFLAQFSVIGGPLASIKSFNGSSIQGGVDPFSGSISATGNIGPVVVGNVHGASGTNSGQISAGGNLESFFDFNEFTGGSGASSGTILVKGNVNSISIGGVAGGAGLESGRIFVKGNIGSFATNSLVGSSGDRSGSLISGGSISTFSSGLIKGDTGVESGRLRAAGLIGSITFNTLQGGSGDYSGSIRSDKGLPSVTGGEIKSGFGLGGGSIVTNGSIGSIEISATVAGELGAPVVISALGKLKPPAGSTTNITIGDVHIAGAVTFLDLLAGYDVTGKAVNADAQVGNITIDSSVSGSNFVAGVKRGADGIFGTADDKVISGGTASVLSKIASITISGQTLSTLDPADGFGVVAQQINGASVNGTPLVLTAGPSNDHLLLLGTAGDFRLNEV